MKEALFGSCVIIAGLLLAQPAPYRDEAPPLGTTLEAAVTDVHDGDTITVQTMPRILRLRLKDCWCQELTRPAFDKTGKPIINPKTGRQASEPNPEGIAAGDRLRKAITGKTITVHIPFKQDVGAETTMGRFVAVIWDEDGKNLNEWQVKDGFATKEK